MENSHPAASPVPESHLSAPKVPEVSIIVPARNEGLNLAACLESLVSQTGVVFEMIVVDDHSTDQTAEIARSFPSVRLISLDQEAGVSGRKISGGGISTSQVFTGKNNALIAGAGEARAAWLLFTDADTIHLPGSLERALAEAKREQADLLSYSPAQIVVTFPERAAMPVIFAELAAQYPPRKVRENSGGVTAANGQYILVRRTAYEKVGGHRAVAAEILEDVALARAFREAGFRVYFRYGGDAVRTRMYRSWAQLREGWTKNLAQLFPRPAWRAARNLLWWIGAWFGLAIALSGIPNGDWRLVAASALWLLLYSRIAKANFSVVNNLLAMALGLPLFAYLLLRSRRAYAQGRINWKGRTYEVGTRERKSKSAESMELMKVRVGN
jgi:glycosyltransferase involved in cell wall biosynthesis